MIYRVERGGNYGWSVMEGPQPVRVEGKRGPTPILPPRDRASPLRGGLDHRRLRLSRHSPARAGRGLHLRRLSDRHRSGACATTARRSPGSQELARTPLHLVAFGESQRRRALPGRPRSDAPDLSPGSRTRPRRRKHDFPRRLSETGLFRSTRDHQPAPGVDPLFGQRPSSGPTARRPSGSWRIPGNGRIALDEQGNWQFPEGSVLARTVSIETENGQAGEPPPDRDPDPPLRGRGVAALHLRLERRPVGRRPGRCEGHEPRRSP